MVKVRFYDIRTGPKVRAGQSEGIAEFGRETCKGHKGSQAEHLKTHAASALHSATSGTCVCLQGTSVMCHDFHPGPFKRVCVRIREKPCRGYMVQARQNRDPYIIHLNIATCTCRFLLVFWWKEQATCLKWMVANCMNFF